MERNETHCTHFPLAGTRCTVRCAFDPTAYALKSFLKTVNILNDGERKKHTASVSLLPIYNSRPTAISSSNYIYTHTHIFFIRHFSLVASKLNSRNRMLATGKSAKGSPRRGSSHRRGRGRAFGSKKRASARALAARAVCVRAHARARNIPRGRHTRERGKVGRPDRVLQAKEPRYVVAMVVTEKSGVACGH